MPTQIVGGGTYADMAGQMPSLVDIAQRLRPSATDPGGPLSIEGRIAGGYTASVAGAGNQVSDQAATPGVQMDSSGRPAWLGPAPQRTQPTEGGLTFAQALRFLLGNSGAGNGTTAAAVPAAGYRRGPGY